MRAKFALTGLLIALILSPQGGDAQTGDPHSFYLPLVLAPSPASLPAGCLAEPDNDGWQYALEHCRIELGRVYQMEGSDHDTDFISLSILSDDGITIHIFDLEGPADDVDLFIWGPNASGQCIPACLIPTDPGVETHVTYQASLPVQPVGDYCLNLAHYSPRGTFSYRLLVEEWAPGLERVKP